MTESEWLTNGDPAAMLAWVTNADGPWMPGWTRDPPKPSDRKMRLFGCAVEREWWRAGGVRMDSEALACVKVAEALADEYLDADSEVVGKLTGAPWLLVRENVAGYTLIKRDHPKLRPAYAALLREVVGNPFRPAVILGDSIATLTTASSGPPIVKLKDGRTFVDDGTVLWVPKEVITPTVRSVAQAIYLDCDFAALPVLADALEEAGCTEVLLLLHLRGKERCRYCLGGSHGSEQGCGGAGYRKWPDGGFAGIMDLSTPHVRGCWALDLILGKE